MLRFLAVLLVGATVLDTIMRGAEPAPPDRTTGSASSMPLVTGPDLDGHFDALGVRGSIVLVDGRSGLIWSGGDGREDHGFVPASTFKVFNSLVALEEGIVSSVDHVFTWDGVDRGSDGWNRNLSLREAFRSSAVWCFQRLAAEIGADRMTAWMQRAGYGNALMDAPIDHFWLDGGLRISQHQQVEFLRRLREGDLPFSARTMAVVRDLMLVETRGEFSLHAKTGWGAGTSPGVGWYVGWVERTPGSSAAAPDEPEVIYFATLIDIVDEADAEARRAITHRSLRDLGWWSDTPADSP